MFVPVYQTVWCHITEDCVLIFIFKNVHSFFISFFAFSNSFGYIISDAMLYVQ